MAKKDALVNGFKVSEEWYAMISRIADERGTTIGGAIQYLVKLGLPLYEKVRAAEKELIDDAVQDIPERQHRPVIKRIAGKIVCSSFAVREAKPGRSWPPVALISPGKAGSSTGND